MNVCIIRHSYYPEVPPTKRNAEALVSHDYGVDVICLRKKGQKSREIISGIKVHRLPVEHKRAGKLRYVYEYLAFFVLAAFELSFLHLKRKFKVIEVDAMPDFLVFTTLLVKASGGRVVLNMLDSVSQVFSDKYKVKPENFIIRVIKTIERGSINYADHVLFCNYLSRERYIANRKGKASKISVVMNVPDEELFYPRSAGESQTPDHFRVITHGSILERYGVHTLIQAVPLLLPHIPEIKVNIVGDGEYRSSLQKMVTDLGIEKYVQFTGFVPMTTIPGLIAESDIGIVPILMHMQPTKLFEYVAMGKPVVASDFPAMRNCFGDDSVRYYKPGDVHELADHILDLYHNPKKRAALARAAFSVYQQYRWNVMKTVYTGIFDRLATKGKAVNS